MSETATIAAVLIAGLTFLSFLAYYLFAFLVRQLAERNLFVTFVREATAKAIMINGKFAFFVMSFSGRKFAGERTGTDDASRWEIIDGEEDIAWSLPFLGGIRWIGLPPFADTYYHRFVWTSLEEQMENDGLIKKPVLSNKVIDYILLQEDVYVSKLERVECGDNIPLDTVILISGYITNPYRALFRIEHWLEATNNMVGSKMRDFFGPRTYAQLRQLVMAPEDEKEMPREMYAFFDDTIQQILRDWGFKISFIRIYSIDPGSELASEFIRASTQLYVAEQRKLANIAEGEGLAARDLSHFEAIAKTPNGVEMFKWQRIGESGLTTYVEGGGVTTAIPVGGQERRREQPSSNPSNDNH